MLMIYLNKNVKKYTRISKSPTLHGPSKSKMSSGLFHDTKTHRSHIERVKKCA